MIKKKIKPIGPIDVDAELMAILSAEIASELDKAMFDELAEQARRDSLTPEQRAAEDYDRESDAIVEKLKKAPRKTWYIPPAGMTVTTQTIQAWPRKLTAEWTIENLESWKTPHSATSSTSKKTKKPTK